MCHNKCYDDINQANILEMKFILHLTTDYILYNWVCDEKKNLEHWNEFY